MKNLTHFVVLQLKMYNLKLVEVVDGFCITCLIPLAVFTLFFNLLALYAVIKLRSDHHVSILGHLVFCDILLVLCQAYTLKVLPIASTTKFICLQSSDFLNLLLDLEANNNCRLWLNFLKLARIAHAITLF